MKIPFLSKLDRKKKCEKEHELDTESLKVRRVIVTTKSSVAVRKSRPPKGSGATIVPALSPTSVRNHPSLLEYNHGNYIDGSSDSSNTSCSSANSSDDEDNNNELNLSKELTDIASMKIDEIQGDLSHKLRTFYGEIKSRLRESLSSETINDTAMSALSSGMNNVQELSHFVTSTMEEKLPIPQHIRDENDDKNIGRLAEAAIDRNRSSINGMVQKALEDVAKVSNYVSIKSDDFFNCKEKDEINVDYIDVPIQCQKKWKDASGKHATENNSSEVEYFIRDDVSSLASLPTELKKEAAAASTTFGCCASNCFGYDAYANTDCNFMAGIVDVSANNDNGTNTDVKDLFQIPTFDPKLPKPPVQTDGDDSDNGKISVIIGRPETVPENEWKRDELYSNTNKIYIY